MRRSGRADAYENGRNRPPGVDRSGSIAEMAAKEADNLVAELGQGLPGVAGEFVIRQILQQSWSQGEFSERPDRADGFSHDKTVGITQERGEQGVERIGEFAERRATSMRLRCIPRRPGGTFHREFGGPFRGFALHRGARDRRHCGAHRKISAVSKFCEKREGSTWRVTR